jgi:predicted PurR-regulated permease PerM
MDKSAIDNVVTWALIIGVLVLTFIVIRPIALAILIGILFGYLFKPVENKLRKLFRNKNLSAIILIILIIFLLIFPIIYFAPTIVKQTFKVYNEIQDLDIRQTIINIIPSLKNDEILYQLNLHLSDFMDNIAVNIPNILFQIFACIFTFFFVVRDFDIFKDYLSSLLPFPQKFKTRLTKEFTSVTNAVLMGQVLIGIIQGAFMGIGFLVLGFDNVLILTLLSMVLGIIPIIGPWIVWLPVGIYTLVKGDITTSLILMAYGGIFVSNIDNLIRPYLVSKSSNLPVIITLIGTVGGLLAFGFIGLVLGPLILSYALIVVEAYKKGDRFNSIFIGDRNEAKNKTT